MSQISGVRRSLSHANSLPAGSAPLPKFGVPTDKESELSEVRISMAGIRTGVHSFEIEDIKSDAIAFSN